MNEQMYKNFVYCCNSVAIQLHFDNSNDGYINNLLAFENHDGTFIDTITKNNNIIKGTHYGVCFTMACYIFNLLTEMGAEEYYLMSSSNGREPNTVVLYKYDNEYKICDLGRGVVFFERKINDLFEGLISNVVDISDMQSLNDLKTEIGNQKFYDISVDEYIKIYPKITCDVILHSGNEDKPFFEIPRVNIEEFIQNKLNSSKSVK